MIPMMWLHCCASQVTVLGGGNKTKNTNLPRATQLFNTHDDTTYNKICTPAMKVTLPQL